MKKKKTLYPKRSLKDELKWKLNSQTISIIAIIIIFIIAIILATGDTQWYQRSLY